MFGLVILGTAVAVVLVHLLLKTANWSVNLNNNVALVTSVVGGVISIVAENGGFDFAATSVLQSVVLVYGASQAVYKVLVAPTGLDAVFTQQIGFTAKPAVVAPVTRVETVPVEVNAVPLTPGSPKHEAVPSSDPSAAIKPAPAATS